MQSNTNWLKSNGLIQVSASDFDVLCKQEGHDDPISLHWLISKIPEPFPKQQISDSSKLKHFADDNFKFDENGRKLSKLVENTWKRINCSLRAIYPFPTVFSKDL